MSIRFKLASVATIAGVAVAVLAAPAYAAPGDTSTTFTLTAGSLGITVPTGPVALGSVAAGVGTSPSAQLGAVTVSDQRGGTATWTASVGSSDFVTGGATADETIGKANADYWSGAATSTTGTATFLPGQLLVANKQDLSASRTAYSTTAVTGDNSATWNPTVVIRKPAGVLAGGYSGTITHSVA
jgi:hypothetical protein